MPKQVALFGYSGHAFLACEILYDTNRSILGYFDLSRKENNPYKLPYLGMDESLDKRRIPAYTDYFVSIAQNQQRHLVSEKMNGIWGKPINIIHPTSWIARKARIGQGVLLGPQSSISSLVEIGNGVICNIASIVEHGCQLGDFVHIAPGAKIGHHVSIGSGAYIGSNALVKPGITIGKNVIVEAGTIVTESIEDLNILEKNP
ncbi:MAG: acetyltransferase [Bacteroidota bacterium]